MTNPIVRAAVARRMARVGIDLGSDEVTTVTAPDLTSLKRAVCDEIDARAGMLCLNVTITTPTAATIIFRRSE